jgi:hypothetical protein
LLAQRLSVRVERVPDHAFEANDGRLGQCMTIVPCHLLGWSAGTAQPLREPCFNTAAPRCVPAAATPRLTSPVVLPKEGGPPVGRGDSGRPIRPHGMGGTMQPPHAA